MVQSLKDAVLEIQTNSVVNITKQENNEFKLFFFGSVGRNIFPGWQLRPAESVSL